MTITPPVSALYNNLIVLGTTQTSPRVVTKLLQRQLLGSHLYPAVLSDMQNPGQELAYFGKCYRDQMHSGLLIFTPFHVLNENFYIYFFFLICFAVAEQHQEHLHYFPLFWLDGFVKSPCCMFSHSTYYGNREVFL